MEEKEPLHLIRKPLAINAPMAFADSFRKERHATIKGYFRQETHEDCAKCPEVVIEKFDDPIRMIENWRATCGVRACKKAGWTIKGPASNFAEVKAAEEAKRMAKLAQIEAEKLLEAEVLRQREYQAEMERRIAEMEAEKARIRAAIAEEEELRADIARMTARIPVVQGAGAW